MAALVTPSGNQSCPLVASSFLGAQSLSPGRPLPIPIQFWQIQEALWSFSHRKFLYDADSCRRNLWGCPITDLGAKDLVPISAAPLLPT